MVFSTKQKRGHPWFYPFHGFLHHNSLWHLHLWHLFPRTPGLAKRVAHAQHRHRALNPTGLAVWPAAINSCSDAEQRRLFQRIIRHFSPIRRAIHRALRQKLAPAAGVGTRASRASRPCHSRGRRRSETETGTSMVFSKVELRRSGAQAMERGDSSVAC